MYNDTLYIDLPSLYSVFDLKIIHEDIAELFRMDQKTFFIFIFNILQKHLKDGRTVQRLQSTITLIEHYNVLNRIDLK